MNAILEDTFPEQFQKKKGKNIIYIIYIIISFFYIIDRVKQWDDVEERRQFLTAFAKKLQFDPAVDKNWQGSQPQLRAFGVSLSLSRTLIIAFVSFTHMLCCISL